MTTVVRIAGRSKQGGSTRAALTSLWKRKRALPPAQSPFQKAHSRAWEDLPDEDDGRGLERVDRHVIVEIKVGPRNIDRMRKNDPVEG
jgi:hypothetical protein